MKKEFRQKAAELQGKRYDMEVATKAVSIDEEAKTATFVMSTATIDRHGDIVDQDSWKLDYFEQNPAFFWGHRSDQFPLGKWVKVWFEEDPEMPGEKMMLGTAEFAVDVHADIERAWNHVKRGDLNMVSVGFIPHVVDYDEKKDAFVLKSCELLECSLVGIGANRRALVKDSSDVRQELIEAKAKIEEEVEETATDPATARKMRAMYHLNKAIRQLQK